MARRSPKLPCRSHNPTGCPERVLHLPSTYLVGGVSPGTKGALGPELSPHQDTALRGGGGAGRPGALAGRPAGGSISTLSGPPGHVGGSEDKCLNRSLLTDYLLRNEERFLLGRNSYCDPHHQRKSRFLHRLPGARIPTSLHLPFFFLCCILVQMSKDNLGITANHKEKNSDFEQQP